MRPSRPIALVLALLAAASAGAGRPSDASPASPSAPPVDRSHPKVDDSARSTSDAAGGATLSARWPLAAPASANLHPYDLAYLDDGTLLVTHPGAGEILAPYVARHAGFEVKLPTTQPAAAAAPAYEGVRP